MKIVATMHRSRLNTYCVARKDQGVNVPADLKGKTVAVPFGTNGEYALAAFLAKNGLTLGDLKLVNLSPPEMIGPITKGDVAGVAAWQPHIGRCEKSLGENGMHFSFDQAYEETYNLVTSTKMATERGTTVAKILKALDRAVAFMEKNPNEAIEIVAQRIGMEKAELERIWPIYNFGLDLRQSLIETMSAQGKWAIERGHQTGVVPNMRDVVSTAALRSLKPESVELPGSN
jgi:NitT/TauT family transport system substrate-binding protein